MPHESNTHKRTWMGFPNSKSSWSQNIQELQKEMILLAKTISKYEPVSMIVPSEKQRKIAQSLIDESQIQSKFNIELILQPLDDIWLRDTGPIFLNSLINQKQCAVAFNFNGWGNKVDYQLDKKLAEFIIGHEQVEMLTTKLVLEGGSLEVDGEGTAILAESCILNDNRNPGWSKEQVELELFRILGIEKVIWVPGVRDFDITDGHIDFYARFIGKHKPGHILVHLDKEDPSSYENFEIIKNSTDSKGNKLTPIPIQAPDYKKIRRVLYEEEESAVGYCNFYVLNDAVIQANFGDEKADKNAYKVLQEQFPERTIEMIQVDNIIVGGGGIHCSTQQQF